MDGELHRPRLVYVAATIAIVVTALWAVLFLPRLDVHPLAVRQGVDRSSNIFFAIQVTAAAVLAAGVILSRRRGRIFGGMSGLLYLAAALLFAHDFMVFDGAVYYLENYEGFMAEAILMLVCVGANLIAAVLAILSGNEYLKMAKASRGEG